jgi:hypothetical protein
MNVQRHLLLLVTLAAIVTPASAQQVAPAAAPANMRAHSAVPIPDFSGIWSHPSFPGFEPPASGPGPVVNKSRRPQVNFDGRILPADNGVLVSNPAQLVGDYTNPILKPNAAEVVKMHGEMELRGVVSPTPTIQCWPEPVPYIFNGVAMQMLQQPDKIIFLYPNDHQVRYVRMNETHTAQVTPSWYGDSVGHYEGDTLVIDTVGIKVGPFAMVDMYGTPHTQALHVVERYKLLDYEAAKEAEDRGERENRRLPSSDPGFAPNPNYKGKGLQLQFTVEDEGVFTMPWSAAVTYRRPLSPLGEWPESVCAENPHKYNTEKDPDVPTANKPDF